MQFIIPESLKISSIIIIIVGIIVAVQGFASLLTGKLYGKEYQKYTEESIKKAARPTGGMMFLTGLVLALAPFLVYGDLGADISFWISCGIVLVLVVANIIFSSIVFKKK